MHIHILGICGTFMGGIALIAKTAGHTVSGSDANVYPPMSTQLFDAGIQLMSGYKAENLDADPDMIVVGNAMSRGNTEVEEMLNKGLAYTSGPQWLYEHVLKDRWVLAVAGTHGKTTTSSMLAWILEDAKLSPGFLIGGVPENFGESARLGDSPFFVVEADEYDTAFFDKRSKFVHYKPRTLVMNNLEFDHADIFDDLSQIQRQFHHLVRTVPGNGLIIKPSNEANLDEVIEQGCWTKTETFGDNGYWQAHEIKPDCSEFDVLVNDDVEGRVHWPLTGRHNMMNAIAALAAARHAGVPVKVGIEGLNSFKNVKRRMELKGEVNGVQVFDDFAHHPTAIETTLDGLRASVGERRILAVLEPRSNTMRLGIHAQSLPASLALADKTWVFSPEALDWDANAVFSSMGDKVSITKTTDSIVNDLISEAKSGDTILVMSNGGFENVHQRILDGLNGK